MAGVKKHLVPVGSRIGGDEAIIVVTHVWQDVVQADYASSDPHAHRRVETPVQTMIRVFVPQGRDHAGLPMLTEDESRALSRALVDYDREGES